MQVYRTDWRESKRKYRALPQSFLVESSEEVAETTRNTNRTRRTRTGVWTKKEPIRHFLTGSFSCYFWWSWTGSNRRPHECHSCALPTELQPHKLVNISNHLFPCQHQKIQTCNRLPLPKAPLLRILFFFPHQQFPSPSGRGKGKGAGSSVSDPESWLPPSLIIQSNY
jgi:hypothetical protein